MDKSAGPHHTLAEVRALLADTRRVMVARSTATQMIAAHFGWDYGRCVAFAKEIVRGLNEENFYAAPRWRTEPPRTSTVWFERASRGT